MHCFIDFSANLQILRSLSKGAGTDNRQSADSSSHKTPGNGRAETHH
jgi:hypothetical protein